jgi:Ca2+-binding RTX toxin-like protein
MARVVLFLGLDLDAVDLNFYARSFIDSDFRRGAGVELEGVVYDDACAVRAGFGSPSDRILFALGQDLRVNGEGEPSGGTVNALGEGIVDQDIEQWHATGLSISFTALYAAALTPDLADDFALLSGALEGDDVILLGDFSDDFDGYGGDDRIVGRAGDDTIDGGAGRDTLLGGTGGDSLTGGIGRDFVDAAGGRDTLYGAAGDGDDTLTGGAGRDMIFLGGGAEVLRYERPRDGGDGIFGFGANDVFWFAQARFGDLAKGALAEARFQTREDNVAQDAGDRFVFRTTDGSLWYDADGAGAADPVLIATLGAGSDLAVSQILIV